MDKLDAIKLFLRIAETGSFSKGARQMGMAQPTASKQIAALEQRLGAQLVRRTTRGLALTEAGQNYYNEALRLINELETLDDSVGAQMRAPSGKVRVTSPPGFAASYLLPKLAPFVRTYPGISIDFLVSQRLVNLVEEGVDVAIRMGELVDSDLRSRRVGTTNAIVVATPAYLEEHGEPRTPGDLERHACIASLRGGKARPWYFDGAMGRVVIEPKGAIQSDDTVLTRAAVCSGLGIAYGASWLFRDELASGALRRILASYDCFQVPISAVWSGDRALPRRVEVFIDFLATICAAEPTLHIR